MTDNRAGDIMSAAPDKSRYPVTGIDISAHNGPVNFERVAADSVDFVLIKATEGATFKDRAFADNYRRARKAGLKVGAYHFFRYDTPGHMQAMNLLHSIKGRRLDLPLAIDVEDWSNPEDQTVESIQTRLREMADYLTARGYTLMIYTNKQGYDRYFEGRGEELPLWICTFSEPHPGMKWHLWQHTHRGSVDGVEGHVDLNTFNGSRESFMCWLDSLAGQDCAESTQYQR